MAKRQDATEGIPQDIVQCKGIQQMPLATPYFSSEKSLKCANCELKLQAQILLELELIHTKLLLSSYKKWQWQLTIKSLHWCSRYCVCNTTQSKLHTLKHLLPVDGWVHVCAQLRCSGQPLNIFEKYARGSDPGLGIGWGRREESTVSALYSADTKIADSIQNALYTLHCSISCFLLQQESQYRWMYLFPFITADLSAQFKWQLQYMEPTGMD